MLAIISGEAEKVPFSACPMAEGAVEEWLMGMQVAMMDTLYNNCKAAWVMLNEIGYCTDEGMSENRLGVEGGVLDDWFFNFPAQCVIMIGQIEWTAGVEIALNNIREHGKPDSMATYSERWIESINYMVGIVRRQLTPLQRKIIGAKLTLDVRALLSASDCF